MSLAYLRGLARRYWFNDPVVRETELAPDQFLAVELFETDFAEGDSSYNACVTGSDGIVYFALSTHHPDRDARLYCLDPAGNHPELIADVGDIVNESISFPKGARLRHGKVHVPLFELSGAIYTASLQAVPPGSQN